MISLKLSQISQIVDGTLHGEDVQITGVSIDSRTIDIGNLFVAIKGDLFDGHNFAQNAVQNGAKALLVEQSLKTNTPYIQVKNTIQALAKLASWWRMQFDVLFFAITGSSGKTTTKTMLASVLAEFYGKNQVLATVGNLNNHLGVPLTLLNLNTQHKVAVIELGANHAGEIKYLADIVRPTVGIITNVGSAHIGEFGSLEQIVATKGELIEALADNSYVVLDSTSNVFNILHKKITKQRLISFAANQGVNKDKNNQSNVIATNVIADKNSISFTAQINYPHQAEIPIKIPIKLNLIGNHNITNALAVIASIQILDIPADVIAQGLANVEAQNGRGKIIELGNLTLIDDSYNANYEAVKSAIDGLSQFSTPKILVLGELAELGKFTQQYIIKIMQYALSKLDYIYLVGKQFIELVINNPQFTSSLSNVSWCSDIEDAFNKITKLKQATVLIKGSRSANLDQLVNKTVSFFNANNQNKPNYQYLNQSLNNSEVI